MTRATFYFDLGSPYAYLAAERIEEALGADVRWQPISLGGLFKLADRSSWALSGERPRMEGIAEVERRAHERSLPPVRWPQPWPGHYLTAMRAATFAENAGAGREFALCAFRHAFQRGRDLSVARNVLDAVRESGLDATEVERAVADPAIKLALREATDAAYRQGVFGVPTVAVEDQLFWGDDRLEEAALALDRGPTAPLGP